MTTSSPTIDRKNGYRPSGPRERRSRPNTGSTLCKTSPSARWSTSTKLRWRIERDYQELKQEVGLGHWKGGDGAASTTTPRCASRPTDSDLREGDDSFLSTSSRRVSPSALPKGYQPRAPPCVPNGTSQTRSQPVTPATDRRSRQHTAEVSVLHSSNRQAHAPYFMMQ